MKVGCVDMSKKIGPRFPEYNWYCVACHECLSDQAGFNDNKFTWKCTHCNYKNSISKDNLRKPYAYLKDQSMTNRVAAFFVGVVRSIFGFLFRAALYCVIAELIVLGTHKTSIDHLSLGAISPRSIEDYFCVALYVSGPVVLALLVLYALSRRFIGRPDTKKHFIRETRFFIRDNLLYPVKTIKSFFKKTTIVDKLISIIALILLIATIALLVYGCMHWI